MKLTKSKKLNFLLGEMNIFSFSDVLKTYPYRYETLFITENESELIDKQRVVFFGKIMSSMKVNEAKGFTILSFDFFTKNKTHFKCVIYNRPFYNSSSFLNNDVTIVGIYNKNRKEINIINMYVGQIKEEERIKPIYRLLKGYPNHHFISLVHKSYEMEQDNIYNIVPTFYRRKYNLIDKKIAIKKLHNPSSKDDLKDALRHLKYEEALIFSLKNKFRTSYLAKKTKAKKEPIDIDICDKFLSSLPFELSPSQYECAKEIIEDMNQNKVMYRLLQGDVGSGKTIVSFLCLYANYLRGDQGVLMAPTDSLARQHYKNALNIFNKLNIKVALLVGDCSKEERKNILDNLKDGLIDIIIGTHALFSKDVIYTSLGLAVVDEQHRFGVNQRKLLFSKGEACDILMMSATPIPRSLALSIYGDLDISTITSYPFKKNEIKTRIFNSYDERIFNAIDLMLKNKRKIYIVAPKIDFSSISDFSIDTLSQLFKAKYGEKVGVLTGRMNALEKASVLDKFIQGDTEILLSTLVIEVGIDIDTASLIIIYGADNFGLASLHQLRGRVGRDGYQSYCLLIYDEDDPKILQRLKILENTNDGFKIAEEDLVSRGAGELAGLKQSGNTDFEFLNLYNDIKIFTLAREDANQIIKNKNDLGNQWILKYIDNLMKKD